MSDDLKVVREALEDDLEAAREALERVRAERDDAEAEAAAEKAAGQRVQLSHYASGRYGEQQTLLSPEASQTLLTRVLAEAGAKIIIGALIVEWDSDERPDIIVFADGNVREINPSEQPDRARRIVAAAQGRETAERIVAAAVAGRLAMHEHRPFLPHGVQLEEHEGPWIAYEIGGPGGDHMAWDGTGQRFDAGFVYPGKEAAQRRVNWLNAHTRADGMVLADVTVERAAEIDAIPDDEN